LIHGSWKNYYRRNGWPKKHKKDRKLDKSKRSLQSLVKPKLTTSSNGVNVSEIYEDKTGLDVTAADFKASNSQEPLSSNLMKSLSA